MQKRKSVPKTPRKERAILKAREFLVKTKTSWLPIDPVRYFSEFGWLLLTWQEAINVLKCRSINTFNMLGAEARTFYIDGIGKYLIVYDHTVRPITRIRWTLAHEIGHIYLGHLTDYDNTAINRGGLIQKEYKVLEAEADYFAAELLGPMPVLKKINSCHPEEIQHICSLSRKASVNRIKDLSWWGHKKIAYESSHQLLCQFNKYLSPLCICKSPNEMVVQSIIIKNSGRSKMDTKRLFVEIDENKRFKKCPRCGNYKLTQKANYCRMCGLYLFNNCTNEQHHFNGYDDNCGAINPGDARYCEICGRETILTKLGLLMSWDELLEAQKEIETGLIPGEDIEDKETENSLSVAEDEIPF